MKANEKEGEGRPALLSSSDDTHHDMIILPSCAFPIRRQGAQTLRGRS